MPDIVIELSIELGSYQQNEQSLPSTKTDNEI
jgi:hypothetical protein